MTDAAPPDPEETRTLAAPDPTPPSTRPLSTAGGAPGRPADPAGVPGFEIEDELGRGGMGVVYRARQLALNRPVALKMVLAGEFAGQKELIRFLAEAEAVAAVMHPHVVAVYEYGDHAGRPFMALELCPGGSLAGLLRERGPLPAREAAALVEKIARGVAAAHDLGIVHRDLKPANVLLDDHGEPKVTDFGLAKRRSGGELTASGAVMGTPAYMAPEQAAGRTKFVGPAADIYALGVVLYECLTGTVPFRDEDTVRLLIRVIEDDPPPVRSFAPEVPRELEAICLKCLAKEPHARYGTAAELADDLRRFLDGEPVAARSTGLFGRMLGTLDRGLKDHEFAAYASAMFWFAAVMLGGDALVTLAVFGVLPELAIPFAQWGRVLGFLGVLAWYRKGRLLPGTATERLLWSIVGGYLTACITTAISLRLALYALELRDDVKLYPSIAGLTALMFFSLGSVLWGWCYAFGAAFAAAGFVMALDLRLAPLVFGLTWAAVLTLIGTRLRRLARNG